MPMSSEAAPTPGNRRFLRWRRWAIDIFLVLLVFGLVQWWQTRPLASGEAPPLVGVLLDGERFDLTAAHGKPILVHFWATWCPVCKVMDGTIAEIARDHPVVTVAMQSGGPDELRTVMRESGLVFPVIADPDGLIATRWGVRAVPATVVVDAAGRIRYATVGASTGLGLRLRLWAAEQWP